LAKAAACPPEALEATRIGAGTLAAVPSGGTLAAVRRFVRAGVPAGRRPGSAGGVEFWIWGPWGASSAMRLCRAGREGGEMSDGWCAVARGESVRPRVQGHHGREMRVVTDRERCRES